METNLLLESQLKTLRLPTFVQHYRQFAEDAVRTQQSYDRAYVSVGGDSRQRE